MNLTFKHELYPGKDMSCRCLPVLSYLSKVNRLKRIMSLIVLALWASCVIRCEAAKLTCSTALACCDAASDDCGGKPASPDHCVCGWVKSGGYIAEINTASVQHPVDLIVFVHPVDVKAPLPTARSTELIFAPPELRPSWQFAFRTAAPPRAPSFVS
jgi:hypothetical protein